MVELISDIEQVVLKALFVVFATGLLAYLGYVVTGARWARVVATVAAGLAALGSIADSALRGIAMGRMPTATLFEYSILMIFFAVALFLVIDWQAARRGTDLAVIGAFVMGVCLALLLFLYYGMGIGHQTASQIMPVLVSKWRTIHIVGGAISYGGIILAFGFGLLYLLRPRLAKETPGATEYRIPNLDTLDRYCYLSVALSFPFLTLLNVTGAIWAASSWNRVWQWDPKEVWGLITWLVYAAYLHIRLRLEWRGQKVAWLAVIGFGVMAFTFLGVNYLPKFAGSLHSYASGK